MRREVLPCRIFHSGALMTPGAAVLTRFPGEPDRGGKHLERSEIAGELLSRSLKSSGGGWGGVGGSARHPLCGATGVTWMHLYRSTGSKAFYSKTRAESQPCHGKIVLYWINYTVKQAPYSIISISLTLSFTSLLPNPYVELISPRPWFIGPCYQWRLSERAMPSSEWCFLLSGTKRLSPPS